MKSTNLLIITSCWTLNEMQIFIFCCVLLWDVHNFVWPRPALIRAARYSNEVMNRVTQVGFSVLAVCCCVICLTWPWIASSIPNIHNKYRLHKQPKCQTWAHRYMKDNINNNATRKENSWFTSLRVEFLFVTDVILFIYARLKSPNDCAQKSYFRNIK
jgi:hypothetical protein